MNKSSMVKKILSAMLASTMAVGLLASCGGDSNTGTSTASGTSVADSGSKGGDTTIRITWWGNQVRNDGTVAALNLYSEQNPGVTFQTEFMDWSGYWDKMATQAASNNLPDIIQQDYAYIKNYQSKGQLESLQSYVDSGALNLDDVPETALSGGVINGELYALNAGTNAPAFIYDPAITAEAGVEIPEQMTWSQFIDISKTIYEKTGVMTDLGNELNLQAFARANGQHMYSEDGTVGIGMDEEMIVDYYAAKKQGVEEGWALTPDILVEKNTLENSAIVDKTAWCYTNPLSNQYVALSKAAGRELAMTLPITADDAQQQAVYLKPSQFWCVASTSKNKEEAVKVLDFYTNSVEANQILKGERGVPISTKVAEAIKPELDKETQVTFDFLMDMATPVATPIDAPYPEGSNEVVQLFNDLNDQVSYGEITPEDAAHRLVTEGTEILQGKVSK